jgi:hypothetical protein
MITRDKPIPLGFLQEIELNALGCNQEAFSNQEAFVCTEN